MKINRPLGQTTVEYMMLLLAVIVISVTVLGGLKTKFIGNGNCEGENSKAFMCKFKAIYEINDYKRFRVRR